MSSLELCVHFADFMRLACLLLNFVSTLSSLELCVHIANFMRLASSCLLQKKLLLVHLSCYH